MRVLKRPEGRHFCIRSCYYSDCAFCSFVRGILGFREGVQPVHEATWTCKSVCPAGCRPGPESRGRSRSLKRRIYILFDHGRHGLSCFLTDVDVIKSRPVSSCPAFALHTCGQQAMEFWGETPIS